MPSLGATRTGPQRMMHQPVRGQWRHSLHFANAPVGIKHPRGNGVITRAQQLFRLVLKAREGANFRTGIVIHQHTPRRIKPRHHGAQPGFKPARPAHVARQIDHMQAWIGDGQKHRSGAIGRGIVDHDNHIDLFGEQSVKRLAQLGFAVVRDNQSRQPNWDRHTSGFKKKQIA